MTKMKAVNAAFRLCAMAAFMAVSLSLLSPEVRATASASRLYVSDERGGTVVVVDAASGRIEGRIAVGKRPRGLALAPDGRYLYVALSGTAIGGPGVDESSLPPPDRRADGIGVIDVRTLKLVRTLQSGPDPETFAVAPNGKTIYVSNEDSGGLSAVDIASGQVRGTAKVGSEPEGVAVRPDGGVVYVACEGDASVYALDAVTLKPLGRMSTRSRPRAITFSLDGHTGFVSNEVGKAITVFDARQQTVLQTIDLPGNDLLRPMGIKVSRDGRSLWVTTGRGGSLLEIDIATARVQRTIAAVGARPWGLALSADGQQAYTANGPSGDISIIDLASGTLANRVHVGDSPWGVVTAR
jgi:YVTN family beta-propeller protein